MLPGLVAIGAILGYPIYNLVRPSLERYGSLRAHPAQGRVDRAGQLRPSFTTVFFDTLVRTTVFTVVNVGLTIVLGTLIALLLVQVSSVSGSS